MAFIPIHAKADLPGQKKGKLTPAQHAQLNAWCLASKTGIFDCLERCEAETTNITNIQNNTTEIRFKNGYFVICGRLVECEAGTVFEFNTPTTGTETGKIAAKFSLGASDTNEFSILQKTTKLADEDLNSNPNSGTYEFELYSYTATPTTVTLTRKQPYIPDLGGKLLQFEASLKDEGKPLHGYVESKGTIESRLTSAERPLGGYNNSKGTIESRLTNLGFRSGSISASNISNATLKRQGNYVIGSFVVSNSFNFVLPEKFRPKETIVSSVGNYYYDSVARVYRGGGGEIIFNTNGTVTCEIKGNFQGTANVSFGYEAQPITN